MQFLPVHKQILRKAGEERLDKKGKKTRPKTSKGGKRPVN